MLAYTDRLDEKYDSAVGSGDTETRKRRRGEEGLADIREIMEASQGAATEPSPSTGTMIGDGRPGLQLSESAGSQRVVSDRVGSIERPVSPLTLSASVGGQIGGEETDSLSPCTPTNSEEEVSSVGGQIGDEETGSLSSGTPTDSEEEVSDSEEELAAEHEPSSEGQLYAVLYRLLAASAHKWMPCRWASLECGQVPLVSGTCLMIPLAHDDGHFSLVAVETSWHHRAFAHYCSRGYALPSDVRGRLEELLGNTHTEVAPLGLERQRSDDALNDSKFWVLAFAAYVRDLSMGSPEREVMLPPCTEFTVPVGQEEADEMRRWLVLLGTRARDHSDPPESWFPEAWALYLKEAEDKMRGSDLSDVSYSSSGEDGAGEEIPSYFAVDNGLQPLPLGEHDKEKGAPYSADAVFPLIRDILEEEVDRYCGLAEEGGYMPSRSESDGWVLCELSSFDDEWRKAECLDYARVLLLLYHARYPSVVAMEWRGGDWRYVHLDSMGRCLPLAVQRKLDEARAIERSSSSCPRGLPDGSDCALYSIAFAIYLSAWHKSLSSMNCGDFGDVPAVDETFRCRWEAKLSNYGTPPEHVGVTRTPSEERGEDLAKPEEVPLVPTMSLLSIPVEAVVQRRIYGLARDDVDLQRSLRRVKNEWSKDLGGMGPLWGRRGYDRTTRREDRVGATTENFRWAYRKYVKPEKELTVWALRTAAGHTEVRVHPPDTERFRPLLGQACAVHLPGS